MKRKLILVAVLAICLSSVYGQQGWTLRQCIDYAIENNLTVKRSENVVDQSDVEVNTAKWARLPDLSGSVRQDFSWGRSSTPVLNEETGNYDQVYVNTSNRNTSFSLGTNVPLFTGFQLPNQYSLAKLNLQAAVADLGKAKDDVALNVASAFVTVLYNKELSKVAAEQVILSKSQLERLIKLYEVGKAASAEVAESRARVAQDEMSAVQADNNYRLALLDLSQLLELPTPEGFSIVAPDENTDFSILTPPDEIYMVALAEKPGIKAAELRLEGSDRSVKIAQSGFYPTLSFNGSLGSGYYSTLPTRTFGQQLGDNFSKYIGLSLNVPLFNRFATRNRVRTARIQRLNYAIQYDEAKKAMYKEIQQAWYNAVAAEAKFTTSEVAVAANEEAFRLMNEKFENGKATSLEFNEAKLNLMRSVSDRAQAKYEYMFSTKVLNFYKGMPIE